MSALARYYRRAAPPVRVAVFLAGCVGLSLAWGALVALVLQPGLEVLTRPDRHPLAANAYLVGSYAILMGGSAWCWLRLQGGSLRTLGWTGDRRWLPRLAGGCALGLATLGGLFALEVGCGWLQWDAGAWARTPSALMGLNAVTALFFGLSEEALFRGFILSTLARHRAWGPAGLASAWLFATAHFLRFDLRFAQIAPPWTGLFLAGCLLALLRRRTGSIWLGAGLHAAWVYLFFLSDRQRLLIYPITWNWATGGGYPLAGAAAITLLVVMIAAGALWKPRSADATGRAREDVARSGVRTGVGRVSAAVITEV